MMTVTGSRKRGAPLIFSESTPKISVKWRPWERVWGWTITKKPRGELARRRAWGTVTKSWFEEIRIFFSYC